MVSTYQIHLWPAELGKFLLMLVMAGDVVSCEAPKVVLGEEEGDGSPFCGMWGRRRKELLVISLLVLLWERLEGPKEV